jgi:hypothetical protein
VMYVKKTASHRVRLMSSQSRSHRHAPNDSGGKRCRKEETDTAQGRTAMRKDAAPPRTGSAA